MRFLLYQSPPRLCLVLLLVLPLAPRAATIVVDASGDGDYLTIQEGINAAAAGDTVEVAAGTYRGALNRELDTGGKALTLRSRDGAASTVLDCENLGRGFYIHRGESNETVIQGFTVRRGAGVQGGAMLLFSASPIVEDCVFTGNLGAEGGAIHARIDSAPQIRDCLFEDNVAYDYGGAIYSHLATPYVSGCDFTRNTASMNGGAISLKTGTVARVYDCTFTENSSEDGGGIYIGILTEIPQERDIPEASIVNYCRFFGNTADRGGGLFVSAYSWSLCTYSTFAHNTAEEGGGIYVLSDLSPTLYIDYCTIVLNSAVYGGGIYAIGGNEQYQPTLKTTVIAFNTQGEALHRQLGAPVLVDLVISYGNEGGNDLFGTTRIKYVDPLFCDVYGDDFSLCENSPCRKVNNELLWNWDYLIGATGMYCGWCMSPVQPASWGSIKAMFR